MVDIKYIYTSVILVSVMLLGACSNDIKDSQTYQDGKSIYNHYCAKCHSEDGSGLGELYPPLKNNMDITNQPYKMICYIKNGVSGEMVINGKKYNQKMPPLENAEESDIAAVLTYISNSFGNKGKVWDEQMVSKMFKVCK
jgi:mono/diheme cytochrome c family protein